MFQTKIIPVLTLVMMTVIFSVSTFAQKQIYIPQEWQQESLEYSFDRSAQSENFIVFWGPLAGLDPKQAPADIVFDPEFILNTAEDLYSFYVDSLQFIPGDSGLITEYKMILVMLHTWEGLEGWAFGGSYDQTVGAMWMHPHAATAGTTLAHEFTHALQNYTWMMYPGHSFINNSYVGSFWESHAEFMALQRFPQVARQFDISRWMNTSQFHWSSTRHHYQAFMFLEYIRELEGIEFINRMWRESLIGEHPLETLRRLSNRTQEELNDLFADYARKNVTWDYEIGENLRAAQSALPEIFNLNPTVIPYKVSDSTNHYRIQDHRSPQDYGYNIIKLIPAIPDSCEIRKIYLKFKGQGDVNTDAGWRYSLVATDVNGSPRYSPVYNGDAEIEFEWTELDSELFLVVSGAPSIHHNYDWEIGFPKIYRYPYEFTLEHAVVDGYQEGFVLAGDDGSGTIHPNGGGFVASGAYASPEAYVGPYARVLDNARIEGNARLEDFGVLKHNAILQDEAVIEGYVIAGENATIREQARVSGFARIWGGSDISGHAVIKDHVCLFNSRVYDDALLEHNVFCWGATLYGDIRLAGDAEYFRDCGAGTYLQVQGAWGRDCDGLYDHEANADINTAYTPFNNAEMKITAPIECFSGVSTSEPGMEETGITTFPNPVKDDIFLSFPAAYSGQEIFWIISSVSGSQNSSGKMLVAELNSIALKHAQPGLYLLSLKGDKHVGTFKIVKQ